jgi:hypothetical protein
VVQSHFPSWCSLDKIVVLWCKRPRLAASWQRMDRMQQGRCCFCGAVTEAGESTAASQQSSVAAVSSMHKPRHVFDHGQIAWASGREPVRMSIRTSGGMKTGTAMCSRQAFRHHQVELSGLWFRAGGWLCMACDGGCGSDSCWGMCGVRRPQVPS